MNMTIIICETTVDLNGKRARYVGQQEQQTRHVAIVTGASAGIGEATARALHAAGYRVFGTYRKPPASRLPGVEYLVRGCDQRRIGEGRGGSGAGQGRPHRPPGQQRRRGLDRRCGGVIARAGQVSLRRQPVRRHSRDQRRASHHAPPGVGTDRQHQLGHGPDPGAVHGPVRREQARRGGLFRVARP